MFLKAISAHIRGLIKPNRVELWLILLYRVLSYQSGLDIQCTSYHGGKEEAVDGSTLLESYVQLSANQRPVFYDADQSEGGMLSNYSVHAI